MVVLVVVAQLHRLRGYLVQFAIIVCFLLVLY